MENETCYEQLPVPEKKRWVRTLCVAVTALASLALTVGILLILLGTLDTSKTVVSVNTDIPDIFEAQLTDQLNTALDGLIPTKRVYKLSDRDMAAPEPNQALYGETKDPTELQWLFDEAAELLDGQTTLFTPETAIRRGTKVTYYLDETIFAVTWKRVINKCEYTFTEVKIAHPTQFRRYLSDGKYASGVLHTTTEMSDTVNAVVASAGDYYSYRKIGIVINGGTVYRSDGQYLDTCYIDKNGDLLFTKRGEITDEEALEKYVEENNIRFSLSFGPIMLQDGKYCVPYYYAVGEIQDPYARAALCQMDELHYVLVNANIIYEQEDVPTVAQFARSLQKMGIPTAYALDGGQTATITMNDQLMNRVSYGAQREISDIIYFATAIPSDKK